MKRKKYNRKRYKGRAEKKRLYIKIGFVIFLCVQEEWGEYRHQSRCVKTRD